MNLEINATEIVVQSKSIGIEYDIILGINLATEIGQPTVFLSLHLAMNRGTIFSWLSG